MYQRREILEILWENVHCENTDVNKVLDWVSLQEWSSVRWGTAGAAAVAAAAREEAASAARTEEKTWNTSNNTRSHDTPGNAPILRPIDPNTRRHIADSSNVSCLAWCQRLQAKQHFILKWIPSSADLKTDWVHTGSHSWEAESPVPVPGGWAVEAGGAERGEWGGGHSAQETGSRRSDCPAHRSYSAEDFLRGTPWARPPRAKRSCKPDWCSPNHRSILDSGRSTGVGRRRRGSAEEEEYSGRRGRSYCGRDYQSGGPETNTWKIILAI